MSHSFTEDIIPISFPISSMSSTYITRNTTKLPLTLLYTHWSSMFCMKSNDFDNFIKQDVSTPRTLHQPINGSMQLAYLMLINFRNEAFRSIYVQFFLKVAIQKSRLHIHFDKSHNHGMHLLQEKSEQTLSQ